jgi:hypothetical protein
MRILLILWFSYVGIKGWSAEVYTVLGTPGGDHVVVQLGSLPVSFALAHVAVPANQQAAAQTVLASMLTGKRVEVLYVTDFGTDLNGAARVQILLGKTNVNEELVARGLASYQAVKEGSAAEGAIKRAQDKAKKAGVGMWQANPVAAIATTSAVATSAVATSAVARAAPQTVAAKGPFCSEIDNNFYYASGAREVANVSPQRLIYYADEATAVKAGKKKSIKVETVKRGRTLSDADSAYQLGKEIAAQAVDAGNTAARDELYEKAYASLTQAMQIYSDLVDQQPQDEVLSSKLQQCMQLRYGTVKMRRFTH